MSSPYDQYGSGTQRASYLASGTSGEQTTRFTQNAKSAFWFTAYKRRFTRLEGNGKQRFSGHSQNANCRYSAISVYAFKGPLAEGAGSAVFFRRDWRRLDLGFCVLILILSSSAFSAAITAGPAWRGKHAPHSATLLPTRRKNRAPAHLV